MNKPLHSILFTHDDLDGAGCRVIYTLAHQAPGFDPDSWLVVNCSNANVNDLVEKTLSEVPNDAQTEICFGDICCCRELLEKLVAKYNSVRVWDHHRTNFWAEMVCGQSENTFATIIPENEFKIMQSGTSIMYQFYSEIAISNPSDPRAEFFRDDNPNKELLAKFVDTVRSYDTWEWKDTNNMDAKELQTLFFLLGMDRFCGRFIDKLTGNGTTQKLINDSDRDFVTARIENEQERINKFSMDDVYLCEIRGYKAVLALNTIGMNVSDLGNQFLTKHPEIDIFASFSFADGGTFSFRCIRDDINLGEEIAQPIGGGGHPKASGAPICDELREILKDILICEMNGEAYHFN